MKHCLSISHLGSLLLGLVLAFTVPARAQDKSDDARHAEDAQIKPTSRMITLSDFGAEDLAYLSIPTTPPTVGVVLVPDAYGLDNFTKAEATNLAALGYLVVAVDIYNGHVSTYPGELSNLIANMNADSALKTINAGIRFFHESPKFHVDHVVAMGWGAGATYVFQTARENKGLDGGILFYGPVEAQPEQVGKFSAPLCAVYPDNDPIATHDSVVAFQRLMKDAGNDFEAWFIAAGAGWSNPSSKTYNPTEDREAWRVAMPFLVRIGTLPVKPKDTSIIDKTKDTIDKAEDKIKSIF